MGSLELILRLVQELNEKVEELPGKLEVSAPQVSVASLDELSPNLGLVKSGEFRAGNNRTPGDSFSGIRLRHPPMRYPDTSTASSDLYNLVGVDGDTMQFGIRASDGVGVFGAGAAELAVEGLKVVDTADAPAFHALAADATINSEALTAGDVLLGDNTVGKPNILFDQSGGKLLFRQGTIVVAQMDAAAGGLAPVGVRVGMGVSAAGSDGVQIHDSGNTYYPWFEALYDDTSFWDSDDDTKLIIPAGQAGTYQMGWVSALTPGTATGYTEGAITHNKAGEDADSDNRHVAYKRVDFVGTNIAAFALSGEATLSSGDYIRVWVNNNSNDSTQIGYSWPLGASDPGFPHLWIRRIR